MERQNFPDFTPAIYGKHILVKQLANSRLNCSNYKGTFRIVILRLVDVDYKFTYVDVGCNVKFPKNASFGPNGQFWSTYGPKPLFQDPLVGVFQILQHDRPQ